MKHVMFDWFGYNVSYSQRYQLIKQASFDGTALYWSNDMGNADFSLTPSLARKEGLFIDNIHTSFQNINSLWLDNLEGQEVTHYLSQCVNDCFTNQIPTMVVHLSSGNHPPKPNNLGLNRIKNLVEKAELKGINIALENLRRPDYLAYVFSHISSERLGFCFDSGHQNCFSPMLDLLLLYADRLMALHLHDNKGLLDEHQLPFRGTIDWPLIIRKIRLSNYCGSISLEVEKDQHDITSSPPEAFLQAAFTASQQLEVLYNNSPITIEKE